MVNILPAALAVKGSSRLPLLKAVSNMPILMTTSDGFLLFLSSCTLYDVCDQRLVNHTDL